MDDEVLSIGEMISRRRRDRRMSQARLAQRAGVTRETVYRLERGRMPIADTLMRICDALGLDWSDGIIPGAEDLMLATYPAVMGLRDRRRDLDLTLDDCAWAAGVSAATLSRFERGRGCPPALARAGPTGAPVELINVGLARVLGFEGLHALNRYWRTGAVDR